MTNLSEQNFLLEQTCERLREESNASLALTKVNAVSSFRAAIPTTCFQIMTCMHCFSLLFVLFCMAHAISILQELNEIRQQREISKKESEDYCSLLESQLETSNVSRTFLTHVPPHDEGFHVARGCLRWFWPS